MHTVNFSRKETVFEMDIIYIYILYLKFCSCIYVICSDRTWGKYEYGTILQLIIELIHLDLRWGECFYRMYHAAAKLLGWVAGTCGYGEEILGSINAGNFLTSG